MIECRALMRSLRLPRYPRALIPAPHRFALSIINGVVPRSKTACGFRCTVPRSAIQSAQAGPLARHHARGQHHSVWVHRKPDPRRCCGRDLAKHAPFLLGATVPLLR